MTEVAQVAAAPAAPQAMTIAQAAQAFTAKRAEAQPATLTPSDAARVLGQQAAKARQERQAEAAKAAQEAEAAQADANGNAQDDETQGTAEGETLTEETASDQSSQDEQAGAEGESEEAQTFKLSTGDVVTRDEIEQGFMLKADHTRKTQVLAEERKALEALRTQKLTHFDNLITAAQAALGHPKSMKQWLAEDPVDGMMRFAEQQERFEQFGNLIAARQQEQADHVGRLKQGTIKELGAKHGDKAEDVFSKAVQYVASKTGTDARSVEQMLMHPEAVELVNDAMAYRELKAKEPEVRKAIGEKPKVVKPGPKVSAQSQAQSAVKMAEAKARKSGTLADALALFRATRAANQRN